MEHKFHFDFNLVPREMKVLLELIKDSNDELINQSKNEWFADIDWDYFLKLAIHHRIYPLVYLKLKKAASNLIPPHILQSLQAEYKKNTYQMLHLSGEMEQLSRLFTTNQIHSLFLKGPVIANDLYGDISMRTSKDLDILIAETDLAKAEKALLKAGYQKEEESTVLNERKWRHHHIVYFNPNKKIQIEIHWALHPRPMKEPKFEELWKRKQMSTLTNYPVAFLGKEDLFLYLIAHGARHGWFRLRWLKDIDQMFRHEICYKRLNYFIKKYHYQHLVGQALLLASSLLNSSINPNFNHFLQNKRSLELAQKSIFYIREIREIHGGISDEVLIYHKKYLSSLKSMRQKIFSIIIYFYPNSLDEATLALPKKLYFLYFPLRPFLWTWRKFRFRRRQ